MMIREERERHEFEAGVGGAGIRQRGGRVDDEDMLGGLVGVDCDVVALDVE